jgi:hypothetical protein
MIRRGIDNRVRARPQIGSAKAWRPWALDWPAERAAMAAHG